MKKVKIKRTSKNKNSEKQPPLIIDAFNFKDIKFRDDFNNWKNNFNFKNSINSLLLIFLGSLLTVFSFYYFIDRAHLYTNGLSAFAQLVAKLVVLPWKVSNPDVYDKLKTLYFYPIFFAMNVPILIWGILKVGFRFAIYTTIYMLLNILMVFTIGWIPWLKDFQIFGAIDTITNKLSYTFIFALVGGIIYGAGLGLLFKAGGSSGGMDFISTYISMKRKYSIANIIKNTNIIIVVIVVLIDGLVVENQKNIADIYFKEPYFLATIVYIYIGSFIMNRVYPKYMMMTIFIISKEVETIRSHIYGNNYLRGGNIWKVQGLYSGNQYNMMMTTMSLLEYNFFKYQITNIDPKLFMIAIPTSYMHGGNAGKSPTKNPVDIETINNFVAAAINEQEKEKSTD